MQMGCGRLSCLFIYLFNYIYCFKSSPIRFHCPLHIYLIFYMYIFIYIENYIKLYSLRTPQSTQFVNCSTTSIELLSPQCLMVIFFSEWQKIKFWSFLITQLWSFSFLFFPQYSISDSSL